MTPTNINFTAYFIVNRKTGSTYEIESQGQYTALAHSNNCTEGAVRINLEKLIKGLQERRYRLIPKRLPSKVIYRGNIVILNND